MQLLEVRDISKQFGGIRALEEVRFRIEGGSISSIIGPNGAGKTTLFNCLTGLTSPTKGAIYFSGSNITGLRPDQIARIGIARTFQNIRLFKEMSVIENVMVAQHSRTRSGILRAIAGSGFFKSEEKRIRETSLEYLELVGLEDSAGTLSSNLPYGRQKRLEIARAAATEPRVILLDEPTAGMNPQESFEMMELIRKLRELGKTIILIEHDMKVVMRISENIIVLDHGVKIAEGLPSEIKSNPLVIEAYLGKEIHA